MKNLLHMLSPVLLSALCIAGCAAGSRESAPDNDVIQTEESAVPSPAVNTPQEMEAMTEEEAIDRLYRECLSKTVCIFTPGGNHGTGFIYDGSCVITNAHVLYDTDEFTLTDQAGNETGGTVIFRDESTDIAIIRMDGDPGESVVFGDSDLVKTGDQFLCIGNPDDGEPFAYCTGRCIEPDESLVKGIDPSGIYIPLDAPIVSGYSGGPVFNMDGELVGISHAAYSGDLSAYDLEHLSFAIRINSVKDEIIAGCQK